MKNINDLSRIEPELLERIQREVADVIGTGWFVLGRRVAEFEERFAAYIGTSNCISVGNGTDALEIALRSLSLGHSSRVATVANAGFYSSSAILACGATPCYIDVDLDDSTMSIDHLEESLAHHEIDAVIVTHLYGRLARIQEVRQLCDKHRIPLIEDCAQAHGASLNGRKAGSFGDLSCFSFYPTKNLGAMGDGGAICTSDNALARRLRETCQYGWSRKYHVTQTGGRNSRLDEIQACVLTQKLPYLDSWNQRRRQIAQSLNAGIENTRILGKPRTEADDYVAHLYVLQVEDRQDLMRHLKNHSIPFDVHYPIPDYRQQGLLQQHPEMDGLRLENTECLSRSIITLPCFLGMTPDEASEVVAAMNQWGQ